MTLFDGSLKKEGDFEFSPVTSLMNHGIDLKAPTPLTELDTQIIRLLPVAIEYILSRDAAKGIVYTCHRTIGYSLQDLHSKIADNQHSHSIFTLVSSKSCYGSGLGTYLYSIGDCNCLL